MNYLAFLLPSVVLCALISCSEAPAASEAASLTVIDTILTTNTNSPSAVEVNPFAETIDSLVIDTNYQRNSNGYIELTWHHLKKVEWTERFNEEINASIAYPDFHPDVLYLDGKRVQISGYVIPTEETNDETLIVLSAFPYSNCFFCGGAGPESVMDIQLKRKGGTWEMDDRLTFQGRMKLNDSDLYYLNYILEDAQMVD